MFLGVGLISLFIKGRRFIYVLLSLEILVIGMLVCNLSVVSELSFLLLLVTSVVSSIVGLVMIISLLTSYGEDHVKF
jgi:hypothetical protein